jgi:PHD/YefM family antitoxin component YafN of YafNO toxin-antitoxin module
MHIDALIGGPGESHGRYSFQKGMRIVAELWYNIAIIQEVNVMQIIPMRDLKDTVKIEKMCVKEQGPVYVTKNGYGRLVVMDIDYYERTQKKLEEARLLLQGLKDVKEGKVVDGVDAMERIREKYHL